MSESQKAETLRALHHGPEPLLLPNAWDCASARIFEDLAFPTIATTSAGIAFSLGYPDAQRISMNQMLDAVTRIAACVQVPVTADLEGGYNDIAETARALIDSGAVGLNLEDVSFNDVLVPIDEQSRRIAAVREAGERAGVRVVINARTDLYLAQIGDPATRFERAIERLKAFIKAGADCLFIPGVADESLIRRFYDELKFPLNILATAGTPPLQRLKEIGVARISVGSGIARATMGLTRRIAQEMKSEHKWDMMLSGAIPYAEANQLFQR